MVNMNDKSKVINLCGYPVSWVKNTITGDEWIKANGSTFIQNAEIQAQIDNGNLYIKGIDDIGSHADIYIDNPEFREELKFDDKVENRKQLIVDEDICKNVFESKALSTFKKNVEKTIITIPEKLKIMEVARKVKLNEFDKVKFLEEYCKIKFAE